MQPSGKMFGGGKTFDKGASYHGMGGFRDGGVHSNGKGRESGMSGMGGVMGGMMHHTSSFTVSPAVGGGMGMGAGASMHMPSLSATKAAGATAAARVGHEGTIFGPPGAIS